MNKFYAFFLLFFLVPALHAQKYVTKNGQIKFYSETPVENIEAHNNQVNSALDISNGNFIFKVLIKSFEFKKAMMQEHFNENYMESDKLPTATFSGVVENMSDIDFGKDGLIDVQVIGKLTIHGVTKEIQSSGSFDIKGNTVSVKSVFQVKPSDYEIKISKAVEDQIAKSIEVTLDASLDKMQ